MSGLYGRKVLQDILRFHPGVSRALAEEWVARDASQEAIRSGAKWDSNTDYVADKIVREGGHVCDQACNDALAAYEKELEEKENSE